MNIIVAEDKIVNQKVIAIFLNNAGCSFTIVNDGVELLENFKPGAYDLILMDIMMPRMDGIETMRQLREKYQDLPPIIGLSAYNMEDDAQRFRQLGLDDYIEKPINREKLFRVLDKLVSQGEKNTSGK
jgi:CheY-like chemotaxis protein